MSPYQNNENKIWSDDTVKPRGIMGFVYFNVEQPPSTMVADWLRQKCSQGEVMHSSLIHVADFLPHSLTGVTLEI